MHLILTPRTKVIAILKEISFNCGNAGSLTELTDRTTKIPRKTHEDDV